MKILVTCSALLSVVIATSVASVAQAQGNVFSGTVKQVWEDGFRLKTGEHSLKVDSWDLCGDYTPFNLSEGDLVTVDGEFDDREFDAFSIKKADAIDGIDGINGIEICSVRKYGYIN